MEVGAFAVATPSPGPSSGRIHTPPAPLHGYTDSYEPYTPRKSTRLQHRAANRTPSPHLSVRHQPESRGAHLPSLGSPKRTKSRRNTTMASPASSPQKRRAPVANASHRTSASLTTESTTSAAAALGFVGQPEHLHPGRASISAVGMLITPAKTPQKPPSQKTRDNIQAVARSLFNESEVMPTPKKSRTQNYVLDSFSADDNIEEPIAIYTDSHERIPEVDRSAANPFYGDRPAPAVGLRRSKRQMVSIPGEGMISIDEAVRRDDGRLKVFRGKKIFQKETEHEDAASGSDGSPRRLTRKSIKPRLLFPPKVQEPEMLTDEDEVATEIEDNVLMHEAEIEAENNPTTPMDLVEEAPGTPKAPKFAPASPPTTARATRFGKQPAESTAMNASVQATKNSTGRGRHSPFDGWRRVKGGSDGQIPGQKRQGDELSSSSTKRSRA